jgi:hypothetical protein
MRCTECRYENPAGQRFCGRCGVHLPIACQACGAANLPDHSFCGRCGARLAPEASLPGTAELRPGAARFGAPESYTPQHLAAKILTTRSAIEGERKQVTVMFTDVSGFIPLSEQLDPEEIHGIMDRTFAVILDEVHRYEGTVNQFLGDGGAAGRDLRKSHLGGPAPRTSVPAHDSKSFTMDAKSLFPSPSAALAL